MHIAFLHNLQTSPTPEQAEFDTPETVAAIRLALEKLGHEVTPIDAASSLPHLVTRLELSKPDLVLNTAEGHHGRGREGFYPGLLEQLGLPYTGSDAYVCTVTLDKQLTNLMLSNAGVRVPRSCLIKKERDLEKVELDFPVIAKPNFEGSSKGITADSVARNSEELEKVLRRLLFDYPGGILVEEFISGRDVTVPYIQGVGVLEPAHYEFANSNDSEFSIYDFDLKQNRPDDVSVVCPADVTENCRKKLRQMTRVAIETLGVVDLCRVDFRVTEDGKPYLIEVNALPSLEPGAAIYLSAAQYGMESEQDALAAILKSALKRRGKERKTKSQPVSVVGLIHNLKRGSVSESDDSQAEFDSEKTVNALAEAIKENGFDVQLLEATPELPSRLNGIDFCFNIAEGVKGRYRESQVPALLELLDMEFTGSESGSLAICHDKGLAKRIVREAGLQTADFQVVSGLREVRKKAVKYPVLLKPIAEGSSKGVMPSSVVHSWSELSEVLESMVDRYRQPVLIEEYLPGREFTVGLLGEKKPRVLPIMEIVFKGESAHPIYSFQEKLDQVDTLEFQVPANLEPKLQKEIENSAKVAFKALGCRDVARMDFRLDESGRVNFIECNPLPGLSPGFSDLCVIAESANLSYPELVGEILTPALRRQRRKKRIKTS